MDAARLIAVGFPLLSGAAGLFIAAMGLTRLLIERAFGQRAVPGEGTIVGFGPRRLPRRIVEYPRVRYVDYPIIDYTTREGQPARFESPNGTSRHRHPAGTRVPIRYDPGNPTDGRIALGGNPLALPIILIAVGLGLALFAVILGVIFQALIP